MTKSPFIKLIMVVIIAVVIPILSFTAFQMIQSNENEAMIQSIYEQQLESVLFSINQHCWNIFNTWAEIIHKIVTTSSSRPEKKIELEAFLTKYNYLEGAFIRFSSQNTIGCLQNSHELSHYQLDWPDQIESKIKTDSSQFQKILKHSRKGYIQPLAFSYHLQNDFSLTLLIFILQQEDSLLPPVYIGLLINNTQFVNEVVVNRFEAIKESNFIFMIQDANQEILYITDEDETELDNERSAVLWILPELRLGVRLKGESLARLSKSRIQNNLIFLLLVNLILFIGIAILLRSIFSEIKLARLKTDFVANVSHDLRTPLALIRMYAETLEMGRVTTEERKMHYYKLIASESARLTQIVTNILDFSRIESHRKEYNLQISDLSPLVETTLAHYQYHLTQAGFDLIKQIDSSVSPLKIDEEAITQALLNLLDNAVKFSSATKKIIVVLNEDEKGIYLSVQDFGIGIPENEIKKIFDKFYRIENDFVRHTRGSGLGLSLVKYIMEVHGGSVSVKSKPGAGSTFTLIFPNPNNS